jgi:hypothetical protein
MNITLKDLTISFTDEECKEILESQHPGSSSRFDEPFIKEMVYYLLESRVSSAIKNIVMNSDSIKRDTKIDEILK